MKGFVFCALPLLFTGCQTLVVNIQDGDDNLHFAIPYRLVQGALNLADDGHFVINDLSGTDAQVDLALLAKAIRDQPDQTRIEINDGNQRIVAEMASPGCRIRLNAIDGTNEFVAIHVPLAVFDLLQEKRSISSADIMRAYRGYRGTMVEVIDGADHIKIELR